jgi:sugar lactone lactonase YvrE
VNQPTGVALDPTGGIYVDDSANNRVLHFPVSCLSAHTNGCAADLVLGEPDFTSHGGGAGQKLLATPWGVAVDSTGNVYVADSANNRVVHFPASCLSAHTNGCAADFVLGQAGFTGGGNVASQTRLSGPLGVLVDPRGNVYVADAGNNRVVRFPASCHASGCAPDLVLGPDFTWTNGGSSTSKFQDPARLAYDPTGGLYVADNVNNRVVHFPASCLSAHASGCAADLVLGEPDFVFTKSGANQSQVSVASGVAAEASGVYIADFYNNRVTHYPADCLTSHSNGCPADFVLGQPDFTSHAAGVSPSQLANPDSVAADCAGGLYVTDRNNNRVLYFPPPSSATSPRDCRLPQTLAAGIALWVWLIVGMSVVVVGAVIGYVLVKRRRAHKPATSLAEAS